MLTRLINWFREQWHYAALVNRYKAAGHATPVFAANREIYLRAEYLERFRDFASEQYDAGVDLDEARKEFVKDNLMSKTTVLDREATASVRAIVQNMEPDEAYHPAQYARWCAEIDAFAEQCQAEMKALHGGDGRSPLQRRVLRGR